MQSNTILLLGLLLVLAWAAHGERPHRKKPAWLEHLEGWQKVFGFIGFLVALLILLNPELLAFGFLADAALFDVLVLALSLQLRSLVFRVWHYIRVLFFQVSSWMIRRAQLDYAMITVTLAPFWSAGLSVWRLVSNYLHPHGRMVT